MDGEPVTLTGNEAKVGDKASDFTMLNMDMQPVSLKDFEGKIKVLSVFPTIDGSVCARQAKKFNEQAADLSSDVVVMAVSVDLPTALKRFCLAEDIGRLVMLSDHRDLDFGTKYGFAIKKSRMLSRGVVIIGKDNIIKYVEYVSEIMNEPDYAKALDTVKQLTV